MNITWHNKFSILLFSILLGGCSALPYVPVVVGSSLGMTKSSLSDVEPYASNIGITRYSNQSPSAPVLKKFKNGRYFLGFTQKESDGIKIICSLRGMHIDVTDIFNEAAYGEVMFDAKVYCNNKEYRAPLNSWHPDYFPKKT